MNSRRKKANDVDTQKASTRSVDLARKLLLQAVAAYNTKNMLRCGDGCYERMQEMEEYIHSGKNVKNAPWKFKAIKSKPKKKESDPLWEL